MFSMKQFFEPTQQAPYDNFQQYLKEDTLLIFKEARNQEEPSLIGEIPKIKRIVSNANGVKINITYPLTPLLQHLTSGHYIQFNGSDLYVTKKPVPPEDLYIPLDIYIYVDGKVTATRQERIPVSYSQTEYTEQNQPFAQKIFYREPKDTILHGTGQTEVKYDLPCQRFAMKAIKSFCKDHKELIHHNGTNRLQLQEWQFHDGNLHVFTTLVPSLLGKLYFNDEEHTIRYTPSYTQTKDGVCLLISEEQVHQLVEMYAPKQKYHRQVKVTYIKGVAQIYIQARIDFTPYKAYTTPIDDFLAFLNANQIHISDELLYEYCLQQHIQRNQQKKLVIYDE